MSPAEKRTARRRAATVVATVLAAGFGGHLVSTRFDVQKTQEAYRAEAVELAQSLAVEPAAEAEGVQLASYNPRSGMFSNTVSPEALGLAAPKARPVVLTYANAAPVQSRDASTLAALAAYTARNLNLAERQQTQLDCLAEAVYYEARSESLKGQMAVAEVVMNRVRDSRYPKTVCEVVYQGHERATGCQFTFTCDGSLRQKPRGEAWDRARVVALHVSLGLNKPVTNRATHYHTDYVNPYWAAGLVETNVVGTHIFYRFPKTGAEWAQARLALSAQEAHRSILVLPEDAAPVDAAATTDAAPPVAEPVSADATLVPVAVDKPDEIASAETARTL